MKQKKDKYQQLINKIKFLHNPIYYKNNIWCIAAWDSWAAKGQARDSCATCSAKFYNAILENKRYTYQPNSSSTSWQCNSIIKVCWKCKQEIEEIIGVKFKTR